MDILQLYKLLSNHEKRMLRDLFNQEKQDREKYLQSLTIDEWRDEMKHKISARLYNVLYFVRDIMVSQLTWDDVRRIRNFGTTSWDEFTKVRGQLIN